MWDEDGGRLIWSDSAKMLLIGLIRKYPDSIRDVTPRKQSQMKKAREAWNIIYRSLVDLGMPSEYSNIGKIKSTWFKMRVQATQRQKKSNECNRGNEMSKIHQSVIDAIEFANKDDFEMPKPMPIKTEPVDDEEDDESIDLENTTIAFDASDHQNDQGLSADESEQNQNTQNKENGKQTRKRKRSKAQNSPVPAVNRPKTRSLDRNRCTTQSSGNNSSSCTTNATASTTAKPTARHHILPNMNPVVVLNRLSLDPKEVYGPEPSPSTNNPDAIRYWTVMADVAEQDLILKRIQTTREQQAIEFDREIHRRNLELIQIRIENEKKKSMQNDVIATETAMEME